MLIIQIIEMKSKNREVLSKIDKLTESDFNNENVVKMNLLLKGLGLKINSVK